MADNFKLESPGPEYKRWSWGKYSTKTKLHSKQEGWVSIVEIFEQELALVGGRCTWTKTTLTRATLTRDTWLGAHWPGPGVPRPGTPITGTPGLGTQQEVHWDHLPHGVGALGFDKAARRQKGPRRLLGRLLVVAVADLLLHLLLLHHHHADKWLPPLLLDFATLRLN